jgi:large subunit ribosomal protein L17
MRKRSKGRKFSRKRGPREAMFKALISALILQGRIQTTQAKAKEIAGLAARFITHAKKADLASRRYLSAFFSPQIVKKLVDEIAPKYQGRAGGYTRILKLGPRKTDGAKMAIIELIK